MPGGKDPRSGSSGRFLNEGTRDAGQVAVCLTWIGVLLAKYRQNPYRHHVIVAVAVFHHHCHTLRCHECLSEMYPKKSRTKEFLCWIQKAYNDTKKRFRKKGGY